MKQYRTSAFFIILALLLLVSPYPALADQQWHYQASAQVAQPGLIETVLPAGVFFGTDGAARTSQLGLTLVGLDQVRQLKLKYDHQMNILTDKHSLAVTIQMTENALLYGNHEGRRLSSGSEDISGC